MTMFYFHYHNIWGVTQGVKPFGTSLVAIDINHFSIFAEVKLCQKCGTGKSYPEHWNISSENIFGLMVITTGVWIHKILIKWREGCILHFVWYSWVLEEEKVTVMTNKDLMFELIMYMKTDHQDFYNQCMLRYQKL